MGNWGWSFEVFPKVAIRKLPNAGRGEVKHTYYHHRTEEGATCPLFLFAKHALQSPFIDFEIAKSNLSQ